MNRCDLVMEGGGVKGIALAGALSEVERAGYTVCRVAGTSAGAIAGAFVAAGMNAANIRTLLQTTDYTLFRDNTFLSHFGPPGKALSLMLTKGIYKGHNIHDWVAYELEKLGVRTFADLALTEPWCQALPPEQRYKLVVVVADISRGQLVRLPWDYHEYGLDPNTQLVADAVRASVALPFLFKPSRLAGRYLVDGGVLSNFPINLFDTQPEWPTFGIKLSALPDSNAVANPISSTYSFSLALIDTMLKAHDMMHLEDPCTIARTMFIDSDTIKPTLFDISLEQKKLLYNKGQRAARRFFRQWDFESYKQLCKQVNSGQTIPRPQLGLTAR